MKFRPFSEAGTPHRIVSFKFCEKKVARVRFPKGEINGKLCVQHSCLSLEDLVLDFFFCFGLYELFRKVKKRKCSNDYKYNYIIVTQAKSFLKIIWILMDSLKISTNGYIYAKTWEIAWHAEKKRYPKRYDTANLWLRSVSFSRIHKNSIFHKNLLVQRYCGITYSWKFNEI